MCKRREGSNARMIRWHDVLHQTEPDAVILSDHKINTFLFYKSHRCRFCHLNRTTISLPFDRRFPSGSYTIRHRGCCRRAERQELSESPRSFAPARKSNNFLNGCGRRRSGSHARAQDPKVSTFSPSRSTVAASTILSEKRSMTTRGVIRDWLQQRAATLALSCIKGLDTYKSASSSFNRLRSSH